MRRPGASGGVPWRPRPRVSKSSETAGKPRLVWEWDRSGRSYRVGVFGVDGEPAELGRSALGGGDRLFAVGGVGLDRQHAGLLSERVEAVLARGGAGDLRSVRGESASAVAAPMPLLASVTSAAVRSAA